MKKILSVLTMAFVFAVLALPAFGGEAILEIECDPQETNISSRHIRDLAKKIPLLDPGDNAYSLKDFPDGDFILRIPTEELKWLEMKGDGGSDPSCFILIRISRDARIKAQGRPVKFYIRLNGYTALSEKERIRKAIDVINSEGRIAEMWIDLYYISCYNFVEGEVIHVVFPTDDIIIKEK